MASLRIVGPGRAGTALARALGARGWIVAPPIGRGDDAAGAAADVDLCVIATPDTSIASVAACIKPNSSVVVAHLSGALGLSCLGPHRRRASIHPLVPLPDREHSARQLVGAWFAVAGDPLARVVVADLGGRLMEISDHQRGAYHAAACIASNHVVALLAQTERVAATVGVPLDAYLDLVRATVDQVAVLGPAAALTGPIARGDWATVDAHLEAIAVEEAPLYLALARAAAELAGRALPDTLVAREVGSCR